MSYDILLNSIPFEFKRLLRKNESAENRLIRLRSSQQFTNNCLSKNCLPKYVNIINVCIYIFKNSTIR